MMILAYLVNPKAHFEMVSNRTKKIRSESNYLVPNTVSVVALISVSLNYNLNHLN
jgi:hypothetical protein